MSITITWTNPTTRVDGTPYDQTQNAGYEVQIDGTAAVSVPVAWATSFDLATLAVVQALKTGSHSAALAVVAQDGGTSAFTSAVTFPVYAAPSAPTNLALAA